jgi:hypothetical protein
MPVDSRFALTTEDLGTLDRLAQNLIEIHLKLNVLKKRKPPRNCLLKTQESAQIAIKVFPKNSVATTWLVSPLIDPGFSRLLTILGRCGKAWCFICEADWENIIRLGGAAHALTCIYNPSHVRKRPDQIAAEKARALEAVHGGQISDELRQAKEHHQEERRATMRPLALEAAEKRMKEMKEAQKPDTHTPLKKRKVALKPAWEEGGHARKPFGG